MLYFDEIMGFRDVLIQYYKAYDVPEEQIDYYLYEILRQQEPPYWRTAHDLHPLSIRGLFENLELMIPKRQSIKIIESGADQLSIDGFDIAPKPIKRPLTEIIQMSPEEAEQLVALRPVEKLDVDYMTWHSELRDKADKIVEESRYRTPSDDF